MNAFTVDVEDGISIAMRDAFNKPIPQTDRVLFNTRKVLRLLEENEVKGTFFVLGQVAEHFPELIKEINAGGHELGVHGYDHLVFSKMNAAKAFEEISRAKKLIEDISGSGVYGHRAPAFSISPITKWGIDIIAEAGFTYDSSIMPSKFSRHGWPDFSHDIIKVETQKGNSIIEVPMTTDSILGLNFPVCGGGYLRLFPSSFTENSFMRIAKKRPVIVYMHPYEVDTEKYPDYYFDELKKSGLKKRLLMKSFWINRPTVYHKLDNLVKKNSFDTLYNITRSLEPKIKTVKV
jgi:polysaccharide deacetylase family protein (PEP-CTERM system associated)